MENNKIKKGWGYELIISNSNLYCGKILHFNKGGKISFHFHFLKDETWYVNSGQFTYKWIDTVTADEHEELITVGNIIHINQGLPHQLIALTEGEIFEVSTEHFDDDSYRIEKGDSQNK